METDASKLSSPLTFVLSEEQVLTVSIQFAQALYGQDSKYNRIMANKEVATKQSVFGQNRIFFSDMKPVDARLCSDQSDSNGHWLYWKAS